jgi:glycine cleavage system pyridoxal-binding protein P
LSYQPHTSEDVDRMLAALGLDDVDQLFQPIPPGPMPSRRSPPSWAGSPPATGTWTS